MPKKIKGPKVKKNKRPEMGEITFRNGKKHSVNIKDADKMTDMEYQAEINRQIFNAHAVEEGPHGVMFMLYLQALCIKQGSRSISVDEEEAGRMTSLPLRYVVALEQQMDMDTGMVHNVFAKFYKNNPALCVSVLDTPTGSNYESVDDMSLSDNQKSVLEAGEKMRENLQDLFKEDLPPVSKMGRWIDNEFWLEEDGVMHRFMGFTEEGW